MEDEVEKFLGVSLNDLIKESIKEDEKVLTLDDLNDSNLDEYNKLSSDFFDFNKLVEYSVNNGLFINFLNVLSNISMNLGEPKFEGIEKEIYKLYLNTIHPIQESLKEKINKKGNFSIYVSEDTAVRWAPFLNDICIVYNVNSKVLISYLGDLTEEVRSILRLVETFERKKTELGVMLPGDLLNIIKNQLSATQKKIDDIVRRREKNINSSKDTESSMESRHEQNIIIESLDDLFNSDNRFNDKSYLDIFIEKLKEGVVYSNDIETIELSEGDNISLSIRRDLVFNKFLSLIYNKLDPAYLNKGNNKKNLAKILLEKKDGSYVWKSELNYSLEDGMYIKFNKKEDLRESLMSIYEDSKTTSTPPVSSSTPSVSSTSSTPLPVVYNKLPASAGGGGPSSHNPLEDILNNLEEIIKITKTDEYSFYNYMDKLIDLYEKFGVNKVKESVSKRYEIFKKIFEILEDNYKNLKEVNIDSSPEDISDSSIFKNLLVIKLCIDKLKDISGRWYSSIKQYCKNIGIDDFYSNLIGKWSINSELEKICKILGEYDNSKKDDINYLNNYLVKLNNLKS